MRPVNQPCNIDDSTTSGVADKRVGSTFDETISLLELLDSALPPEAGTGVEYAVEDREQGGRMLHVGNCPSLSRARGVHPKTSDSANICEDLYEHNVRTVCAVCHGEFWVNVNMILLRAKELVEQDNKFYWWELSMALGCEAWKPGASGLWLTWLQLPDADTIRERAKKEYNWNEDGRYAMCFDANGFNKTGCVAGIGEHVSLQRYSHEGRFEAQRSGGVIVHGLVPWRMVEKRWVYGAVTIPVEGGFNSEQVKLAAYLYEAERNKPGTWTGEDVKKAAKNAVSLAKLCLT